MNALLSCLSLILSMYLTLISSISIAYAQENDLMVLLNIKGELTQGSALRGVIPKAATLKLNDTLVRTTQDGDFFIGFGRDADLEQKLTLINSAGESFHQVLTLSKRNYKVQEVNGVPKQTVTPSEKNLKRIRAESALVKQARSKVTDQLAFLETFSAPMEGPITGVYGSQRIYNGVPKRPHFGVDYAGPVGTLVYAPASGRVTMVHPDMFYSGGTLIVDHGFGVSSSFLHLSEILVKEGQEVKQGDVIAKVGQGGRSTGPHLDWRMNWFDVRIDPLKVLKLSEHAP